jgi:hypothetical protein
MIQGAKSGGLLPSPSEGYDTLPMAEHAGCGHHHTAGQRADQHQPEAGQGQYEFTLGPERILDVVDVLVRRLGGESDRGAGCRA